MGTIKATNIEPIANNGTVTLGSSGDTLTVPTGVTVGGLMSNTPAFEARLSSDQTFSDAATVKVTFDTESFDTDNCYDNSTNYRFTPTVAGKYFVYTELSLDGSGGGDNLQDLRPYFYKNGSSVKSQLNNFGTHNINNYPLQIRQVIDMNGTSDYLEVYVYADVSSGSPFLQHEDQKCIFGAYRLIGA